MTKRIGLLAAILIALPGGALAQTINPNDLPLTRIARPDGTPVDPTGGAGGGASTGSVTAAGTNGTVAQAVQGINGGVNVGVSASSWPLPTGAATAAGQASQITALGAPADTAYAGSGSASIIALLKGSYAGLVAPTPTGTNIIGRVGIDQTTPGSTNAVGNQVYDGTTWRPLLSTTTGVLEPPTAASGKITKTSTALTASTSTTIAAANANRIAMGIQCASGGVAIDETGAALTAATVGNGTLVIPSGTAPYFTPPVTTRTAVTAYTATAQTCVVTEYLR